MGLLNRTKDISEQRDVVELNLGAVATGTTKHLFIVPWPCVLENVSYSAQGVSNAMQVAIEKISGAGSSGTVLGISNIVLQNRSTSGVVGFSGLLAAGNTLLTLSKNDVVQAITSVANGNATDLTLALVVRKVQDIVSTF